MQDWGFNSRGLAGVLLVIFGGAVGSALLLEKNGNDAILGTGTSITTAVLVGILLMAPGAAVALRSFRRFTMESVARKALAPVIPLGYWVLFVLSATAVLFLVYISFGMTPRLSLPKSTISWDISRPMTDFFHEGEIIGSIGFFISDELRDIPMLIHGAGRNLLPAWIVSKIGGTDTMVAEMRFVTSAGNFLSMALAATGAILAALVITMRQKLVVLENARKLAFGTVGVLVAMTLVATVGRVTNREVVLFAVILVSILLIWSVSSERTRTASSLAVLLGAMTVVSPLHTYLGSIQSVMVASVAAVISLVISPGRRLALFAWGMLGAFAAFATVSLLGGYWLFQDAVNAILYWSENAEPIWGRLAPRSVLAGSLVLMIAGAVLGCFSLSGKIVGMGDKAVRSVLALLTAIIVISTFSYANLSDMNHFGYGLYVSTAAIAGLTTLLFLAIDKANATVAFVLAALLVIPASIRLLTMGGSGVVESIELLDTPDDEILPPRLFEFATRFRDELEAQDCLLIMSNDGALAYLPRIPLCGPAFNPIHLNSEGDAFLANWLENNPQNLVVDGVDGYGSVGGAPMRERFPLTYEVIDRLYPRSERLDVWEIRLP